MRVNVFSLNLISKESVKLFYFGKQFGCHHSSSRRSSSSPLSSPEMDRRLWVDTLRRFDVLIYVGECNYLAPMQDSFIHRFPPRTAVIVGRGPPASRIVAQFDWRPGKGDVQVCETADKTAGVWSAEIRTSKKTKHPKTIEWMQLCIYTCFTCTLNADMEHHYILLAIERNCQTSYRHYVRIFCALTQVRVKGRCYGCISDGSAIVGSGKIVCLWNLTEMLQQT